MHTEFWILVLLNILMAAGALVKIWRGNGGKVVYRGLWTIFAVCVPGIGPLFALAFFEMPSVKTNPTFISDNDDGQLL